MNPSDVDDLYARLGVAKSSTLEEIKRGYRKLAFQWHPDKNPKRPQAHREFIAVSEAYEILSDPGKRAVYNGGSSIESVLPRTQSPRERYSHYSSIFDILLEDIIRSGLEIDVDAIERAKIEQRSGYNHGQHFGNIYWLDAGGRNLELAVVLESDRKHVKLIKRGNQNILECSIERKEVLYCGEGFLIRYKTSPSIVFDKRDPTSHFGLGRYGRILEIFVDSKNHLPTSIDISQLTDIDNPGHTLRHLWYVLWNLRIDLGKVRHLESERLGMKIPGTLLSCVIRVLAGSVPEDFIFRVEYYEKDKSSSLIALRQYESNSLPIL